MRANQIASLVMVAAIAAGIAALFLFWPGEQIVEPPSHRSIDPPLAVPVPRDPPLPIDAPLIRDRVGAVASDVDRSSKECRICVLVCTPMDVPLAGVCLVMEGRFGADFRGGTTGEDGRLEFVVPRGGQYTINSPLGMKRVVADSPRHQVVIVSQDSVLAHGKVVGKDGAAVASAEILVCPDDEGARFARVTVSDAAGEFAVRVGREPCVVLARMVGYLDSALQPLDAERPCVLMLREAESLCDMSIVSARSGLPVKSRICVGRSVVIRIRNPETQMQERWPRGREYLTADDGCVRIGGLSPYSRDVAVLPMDSSFGAWNGVWDGEGAMTIRLQPSCSIEGAVLDEKGARVAGAMVWVGDPRDWGRRQMESDKFGEFRFDGLAEGSNHISVREAVLGSYDCRIRVVAGESVTLNCVLGARKVIRLLGPSGDLQGCVRVRVEFRGDQLISTTDERGESVIPGNWWGEVKISHSRPAGDWSECEVLSVGTDLMIARCR